MLISNCCGAALKNDNTVCPDCGDECTFDEYDPELDIRHDNWGAPGSTEYNLKLKNETK